MNRGWVFAVAVVVVSLAWVDPASAYSNRVAQYPNGDCDFCHVFPGGPRTPFGLDVDRTYNGQVNWPALFDLDSDGDGYTNGEELGDAYGVWQRGDQDPDFLSAPHDEFSVPTPFGNAPTVDSDDFELDEDTDYSGTLQANDADNDTLRYRVAQAPENGTLDFDNDTGEFTYTPNADFFGEDSFIAQVFDGNNIAADPGVIIFDVLPINDDPTVTTQGDQFVSENQLLTFFIQADDLEDGTPNVTIEPPLEGSTFDPDSGLFSWTPNYLQAGEYEVDVIATDNDGGTATETITITVFNVNRPPVINTIEGAPLDGNEGDLFTFSATAADEDPDDDLTFTWDLGGGNTFEGVDLTAVNERVYEDGTVTVELTVDDGTDTVTDTVTLTIENVLPIVNAGNNQTVNEGTGVVFAGSFVDPGINDDHTITWDYGDGDDNTGNLTPTHAYGDDGTFTAELTVEDDHGEDADTITITVNNVAPVADAGGNQTVEEGQTVTLEGSFVDPGFDDEHTYAWDFGDDNTSDNLEEDHTWADDGTFTVSLTVADDDGGTDTDTVTYTVTNVAPSVISTPQPFAVIEEVYTYEIEAFDPGDDTISYTFVTGPDGMELSGNTITYTPAEDEQDNIYTVTVNVSDEDGGLYAHTWELRIGQPDRDGRRRRRRVRGAVQPPRSRRPHRWPPRLRRRRLHQRRGVPERHAPPRLQRPSAPSINRPFVGELVNTPNVNLVVNNGEDPDGDPVTYTIELYRDSALNQLAERFENVTEGNNLTTVTVSVPLTEDNTYYWRARAYDGRGYSPYSNIGRFIFSLVNNAPTVPNLLGPQGIVQGNPIIFTIGASNDPEGEFPLGYDFQIFDSNNNLHDSAIGIPGRGNQTTFVSTQMFIENETYTWRARATDVRGLSSEWSDYYTITINFVNSPPPTPTLVSPQDNVTLSTPAELLFSATEVIDEDGDGLTYHFRLAADPGFGIIVAESGPVPAENGTATWNATGANVIEDTAFYWDVRAYDGESYSDAIGRGFFFSANNDPPAKVTIQSPADGQVLAVDNPPFTWINVFDPENTAVTYTFEVYEDETLRRVVRSLADVPQQGGTGDMTSVMVEPLDNNKTFYWRVKAVDGDDIEGTWSDTAAFTIALTGDAPSIPEVVSPVDNETFNKGDEIELVWSNATDDGGELTYDLEILNSAGVALIEKTVPEAAMGAGLSSYVVELALAPGEYSWRVKADDGALQSAWSDAGIFNVIEIIAPPPKDKGCTQTGAPGAPGHSPFALILLGLGAVAILRRR